MSPPRHAMVVHAYYPLAETRVQREAEALVAAGWEVDVVCLRRAGQAPRERHRGVEVHRLPVSLDKRSLRHQLVAYVRFGARAGAHLARLHRARPYRSVQVHNLPDVLVLSALGPWLAGTPVVLDLHDLVPEFVEGRFGPDVPAAVRWLARAQERVACGFADHVVTVSDHWRDALVARGATSPDHCSVVLNVADGALFRPVPRGPTPGFRVVYHGTVTQRYGLDLALHAVARLAGELPDLHLTVLGRGDAMPELVALRSRLGIEDRVELRDELVPAEDLPAVLGEMDLGVVPYRDDPFTDGLLPTKLMEYGALGIPAVAAATTAISRYFGGTAVALFPPGDVGALAEQLRRLHDPEARRRLAARRDEFERRFAWDRVASAYVDLVTGLRPTARRPRRRAWHLQSA